MSSTANSVLPQRTKPMHFITQSPFKNLSKPLEYFQSHPCNQDVGNKIKKVCNIQPFDFQSVCVNWDKLRLHRHEGWVLYQSWVCCWMWYPTAVHFQSAWAICFTYLEREGEKRKKTKQLHHAFRVYTALAHGVDSFIRSLWSALALNGQRGLTIGLNWNIIQDVIVCDTQLFEPE